MECELIKQTERLIESDYTDLWFWENKFFSYKGKLTKENVHKEAEKFRQKQVYIELKNKTRWWNYCPYCGKKIGVHLNYLNKF